MAVIDTGLDYYHPDLARENLWRNPHEQTNGRDDDGNGYVDDLIGWNFVEGSNDPWDFAGHGTHVAGLIAATTGNGEGIAGINHGVRIMPLKVLNFLGRGRSIGIAEAIFYAVANGARVINLSLGGEGVSQTEKLAIDYASDHGVVVVVAAGNAGVETADYGPAALESAITVGATGPDDQRAAFSNWGGEVDLVAPGVEVLSLRARRTDFQLAAGVEGYTAGQGFVGPQGRYYRATGTSFSAPLVSGIASLLFAHDPQLSAEQVKRMLLQSARDIDVPGFDKHSGYGLVDARAALRADPDFFVVSKIDGVEVVRGAEGTRMRVRGTCDASDFAEAWLEIGPGEDPQTWMRVPSSIEAPVRGGHGDSCW